MKKLYALPLLCLSALFMSGCVNLSPTYTRPDLEQPIPEQYKEEEGWRTARPMADIDRGSWWGIFNDSKLNELMGELNEANQNIAVAAANLRQARAQVDVLRSAFLPGVSVPVSATRSGTEGGGPRTSYSAGLSTQWEISFWNALPAYEGGRAQAEASAADYATMRLAMQSELAQNYFQLRAYDMQMDLYESTIVTYKRAVSLTQSQFRGGIATSADVAQAEAQLATAEAQYASVQRQRSLLEHSLAVLVGQLPSSFSLERGNLTETIPDIPLGIPSSLLERRPDVSSAELLVSVANQKIGLARAAWFPSLNISGDFLYQGTRWLGPSLYNWSVGPNAALSLFEGGKHLAEHETAWADYEAEVARYRQTVLEAFREVEDNLGSLRHLEEEASAHSRAIRASQEALRISLSQYQGGMTTYLQVVTNQTTVLSNERSAIDVQAQRLIAAVNLVKALGGGWQKSELRNLAWGEPPKEGVAARSW